MSCSEIENTNQFFEIAKWITPVVLFFLGLGFNKLSERLKENRRLLKVESYFYELLYSLSARISQEQEIIVDCINRFKDWNMNNLALNQSSSRVLDRILEIKQEDLFKIFVLRKKGERELNIKDYKALNSIIDYLSLTFPHILSANKKEIKELNIFRNNWNSAHLATTVYHNELIGLNLENSDDSFLNGFIELVKSFNEKNQSTENIDLAVQKLVIPLKNLCKAYSIDIRSTKLMTLCEESTLAFREIKSIRESQITFLLSVETELKDIQLQLIELTEKMKKKKNYVA